MRRIGPEIHALGAHTHDQDLGGPVAGEPRGVAPLRRAADWVSGEPLAYLIEIDGEQSYRLGRNVRDVAAGGHRTC